LVDRPSPRFNGLMDNGGCYPSAAGMAHTRIEHGEDFSLFRMVLSPADERTGGMPALWFSNGDMVVEGSNGALEAATSASSHATNCTRIPHTASKPKAIPITVA
jgi:hypothetical protein